MKIEDKFKQFNLTDEISDKFRYLESLSKDANEQSKGYFIETIVLGEPRAFSNKQGDRNAKLG